jgi:hypothetical protein
MSKAGAVVLSMVVALTLGIGSAYAYLQKKNNKEKAEMKNKVANIMPTPIPAVSPLSTPSPTPLASKKTELKGGISIPTIIVYKKEPIPSNVIDIVTTDTSYHNSLSSFAKFINDNAKSNNVDLELGFNLMPTQIKVPETSITRDESDSGGYYSVNTNEIAKLVVENYPKIESEPVWQILYYQEQLYKDGHCVTYSNNTDPGAGYYANYYSYGNSKFFISNTYEAQFSAGPEQCRIEDIVLFDKWNSMWERGIRNFLSIYGAKDAVYPNKEVSNGEPRCIRDPKEDVMCGYYMKDKSKNETVIIPYYDRIFSDQTKEELGWI